MPSVFIRALSSLPRLSGSVICSIVVILTSSEAAHGQVLRSPKGDRSIVVAQSDGLDHADYRWAGGKFDALKGVALPGSVSATWIGDGLAKVGGPCGPGCSAFFLDSDKGALGPYPSILTVSTENGVFSVFDLKSTISIFAIKSGKALGKVQAPRWCQDMACAYKESFSGGSYRLSSKQRPCRYATPIFHDQRRSL